LGTGLELRRRKDLLAGTRRRERLPLLLIVCICGALADDAEYAAEALPDRMA
jgi:hypothetical protein